MRMVVMLIKRKYQHYMAVSLKELSKSIRIWQGLSLLQDLPQAKLVLDGWISLAIRSFSLAESSHLARYVFLEELFGSDHPVFNQTTPKPSAFSRYGLGRSREACRALDEALVDEIEGQVSASASTLTQLLQRTAGTKEALLPGAAMTTT
jgi:hypothetical protein